MKNKALITGFLRLMTSAIDARELTIVRLHFCSNGSFVSNLSPICRPRFLPLLFFNVCSMKLPIVEWVVREILSMKPGIILITSDYHREVPFNPNIEYFLIKEK